MESTATTELQQTADQEQPEQQQQSIAQQSKPKPKLKPQPLCGNTPAVFKRRQATRHLVVQSPTDHIFSPMSQKLLQRRHKETIKPLDLNDEEDEQQQS